HGARAQRIEMGGLNDVLGGAAHTLPSEGILVALHVGGARTVARFATDAVVDHGAVVSAEGMAIARHLRMSGLPGDTVALDAVGVPARDMWERIGRLQEGVAAREPALRLR